MHPSAISNARWLAHLKRHAPDARDAADPEAVHQMRIALARLRVWLLFGEWKLMAKELRWLRTALGAVRDLDVLLERQPPRAFAKRLLRRREREQRALRAALDSPRFGILVHVLAKLPAAPNGAARAKVKAMAERTLRRARHLDRHRTDGARLHALRRALRRLRYALEWLGVKTTALAQAQEALGAACDCLVALRELAGAKPGRKTAEHRQVLERELDRATAEALAAWRRARPQVEALAAGA